MNNIAQYWAHLLGNANKFSLEKRLFHAICIICFFCMALTLPFSLQVQLPYINEVLYFFMGAVCIVYYLSRHLVYFQLSFFLFAFASYSLLCIIYFLDGGIDGPTISNFFLTFILLISISPRKINWIWYLLHIAAVFVLLYINFYHPHKVTAFPSQFSRYFDTYFTYVIITAVIYAIITMITKSYHSERNKAEERASILLKQKIELEILHAQKDKLFSIIGHDVKSPLNLIKAYLSLVTEDKDAIPAEEAELIEQQLKSSIDDTIIMLDNLLHWSKSKNNINQVVVSQLYVAEILQEVLAIQEKIAFQKDITIHNFVPANFYIFGEKEMMQLILRNLINNAIKFTKNGGIITINALPKETANCIQVIDNGIGMHETQLAQLFEMSATSSRGTQNEKGTGLGLMLCKELIEAQGGSIEVESKNGIGSTFTISLPKTLG